MLTYPMDARGGMRKYEYLYSRIKEDILTGALKAGERLPSKRELSEHLGVSVVTVEGAYSQLMDEGYITSRPKSGFFVSRLYHPGSMAAQPEIMAQADVAAQADIAARAGATAQAGAAAQTREFLGGPASSARFRQLPETPADFPFTPLLRIIREVLNDYRDQLLLRPPNAGCPEFREAVASYLRRYRGMEVQPQQVIIGAGAEYLYGLIAQLFPPEVVFGLEAESYEKIRLVYQAHRRETELLPMDRYGISSEGLRRATAGLLHITPFHSYPTGITAPAAKRYEYLNWAAERKAFLVEDDFSSEFSSPRKPLETIYAMDRGASVIYLNTFTKSLAPSMRVGYMVLPERLLPRYQEVLGFYACPVPALDQYVLAEYMNRGHFERRLNQIRRRLRDQG